MPQIAVTITQELLDKIEQMAQKVNQSRSSMVEFLLKNAVEEASKPFTEAKLEAMVAREVRNQLAEVKR